MIERPLPPHVRAAIRFTVRGIPKAQPRPRAVRRGAHAGVYDPGTSEAWKACVVLAAREHRPESPLEGPIRLSIDFLLPRPKSLMRKRDPDGELWHTGTPDRDNLDKAALDALTADGWFRDDSQVCSGEVRKFYHAKGGVPGARICIEEIEP